MGVLWIEHEGYNKIGAKTQFPKKSMGQEQRTKKKSAEQEDLIFVLSTV